MRIRVAPLFAVALASALALPVLAQDATAADQPGLIRDASDTTLDDFLWVARPIVVFADTPADPRFQQQMDMIKAEAERLVERDVVVLTDTDPSANSSVRKKLRPRGFQMVLIGKEGKVKLRKPFPYSVREITRTIDKMPMRQQEIRDRRAPPPR